MSMLFRPFLAPAQIGSAGWLIAFATHWSDGWRRKQAFFYPRPNGEIRPEAAVRFWSLQRQPMTRSGRCPEFRWVWPARGLSVSSASGAG